MSENQVTLLMVGDVMLGGEFLRLKAERNWGWPYPFENVRALFQDADIVFANLECPLSNAGPMRPDKGMALYASPDSISALKYLNCNVVCLGNNHINDYGEEGLLKTIDILVANNVPYFGAGKNLEEARRGVTIEINGLKIAFLGYTTPEDHVKSIIAGANSAGCVLYDFDTIKHDIDRMRNESQIICISLHWGYGDYAYPAPEQVELAHQIIDAGANVIIGHHPHIIQGVEKYKHGVIFYSFGNFFFPNFYRKSGELHEWFKESNKSIIARCRIGIAKIEEIEIFPAFMNDAYQVILLDGEDKKRAISEVDEISSKIKRNDYTNFWNSYTKRRGLQRLLPRTKELGLKECVRRVSIENIKEVSKLLIKFMKSFSSSKEDAT